MCQKCPVGGRQPVEVIVLAQTSPTFFRMLTCIKSWILMPKLKKKHPKNEDAFSIRNITFWYKEKMKNVPGSLLFSLNKCASLLKQLIVMLVICPIFYWYRSIRVFDFRCLFMNTVEPPYNMPQNKVAIVIMRGLDGSQIIFMNLTNTVWCSLPFILLNLEYFLRCDR